MKKLKKKTLIKLVAAGIAFLGLLGVCIYTVFVRPALMNRETVIYVESQVLYGDLVQGIMENGSVEMTEKTIDYDLELDYGEDEDDEDEDGEEESSRYLQIEEVYVVQGERLEEGSPVFLLSQESIDGVRRKLENRIAEANVSLAEANSEYRTQIQSAKSTYSASVAGANTAGRTYDAAMNTIQQQISLWTADIQVLQEEINDWNEKLTDEDTLEEYSDLKYALEVAQEKLEETDPSSPAAYVANYEEYQSALSAFELLDDELQGYRDGIEENTQTILDRNESILEAQTTLGQEELLARQEYDSSVQDGSLADDIYQYTADSLQETVDEAQQEVEEAKEQLEEFEAFVGEDGTIYADGSGLITEVAYEAGDELSAAGSMLSYVTEDSYTITIDVSEEDISYIAVGDSVEIEINAYPEESYEGTVSAITTSADSSYSTTVNYPVTIHVEGDTSKLFGGMTADITFVTDYVEDVLYVPSSAIVTGDDGSTAVYVDGADGEKELKQVTTGFSNGTQTQITDGLEEGDIVYIASTVSAGMDEESLREAGSAEGEAENAAEDGTTGEQGQDGQFPGAGMPDGFEPPDGFGAPNGNQMP